MAGENIVNFIKEEFKNYYVLILIFPVQNIVKVLKSKNVNFTMFYPVKPRINTGFLSG